MVEEFTPADYRLARSHLLNLTVNEKCIICGSPVTEEDNIYSHIIPQSVLDSSDDTHTIRTDRGAEVGHSRFTYRSYCGSCELCLNSFGECDFNPQLHRPLVQRMKHYRTNRNLDLPSEQIDIDNPKIFHCFVSIAWRCLAVCTEPGLDSNIGKSTRRWLEALRPYIRDPTCFPVAGDRDPPVCSIYVAVPNLQDVNDWEKSQHTTHLWNTYFVWPILTNNVNDCFQLRVSLGPMTMYCFGYTPIAVLSQVPRAHVLIHVPSTGKFSIANDLPHAQQLVNDMRMMKNDLMAIEVRVSKVKTSADAPVVVVKGAPLLPPYICEIVPDFNVTDRFDFPTHVRLLHHRISHTQAVRTERSVFLLMAQGSNSDLISDAVYQTTNMWIWFSINTTARDIKPHTKINNGVSRLKLSKEEYDLIVEDIWSALDEYDSKSG